ncbi:hypothetical protein [Mycobacterium sp.]|uniref:hypothetical protein n=1 Tax=Mycobacterium sp. TaxID=1785 RepID=UPI002CC6EA6F|nr:hypothetical protein [Mycobacterium sp.]HTQ22358.1 hypothetical protein [Mycobacterium sp.]
MTIRPQWQPYVDAAAAYATTMYTVSPEAAERQAQRMLDMSVGPMHEMLTKSAQNLVALWKHAGTHSTCTVNGAGLEELNGDKATVLVAARVQASGPGDQAPSADKPQAYRLRLFVEKQSDGTYKIADLKYPDGGN